MSGTQAAESTPGPKPARNLFDQLKLMSQFDHDTLGLISGGFRDYGDVWAIEIGAMRQYMFSHPDHYHEILVAKPSSFHKDLNYKDRNKGLGRFMGNGLVTSDGDFWKRQRKLIQPAFHARRIEGYAQSMVDITLEQISGWRDGASVQVDEQMMEATLNVVTRSVFDVDIASEAHTFGDALTTFQEMSNNQSVMIPAWVPTPLELRTRRALREVNDIIYGLIRERKTAKDDRGDLLSMLIDARDDDGRGMTDEEIRDELVTLFMAGHETTANTMNWTWYLLAQHPEVEAKLHSELDAVLAGRAPTLSDLRQLPYTEMVIKESMRLYPAVFAFGRQAIEDVEIGRHPIPKGSSVGMFPFVTHRDPRWWGDDADQFKPERFTPEREAQLKKYAYMPFSTGPRVCIGNSFAMMEAHLMLATIAQHWRLQLQPGQRVEPEPLITLRPKGGLRLIASARSPQPAVADQAAQAEPLPL
ncbi:MAG: cytochrome P450 [Anaerolineae bacterium]|nr:cytochrome P450 [Anaerolineae bacterium]